MTEQAQVTTSDKMLGAVVLIALLSLPFLDFSANPSANVAAVEQPGSAPQRCVPSEEQQRRGVKCCVEEKGVKKDAECLTRMAGEGVLPPDHWAAKPNPLDKIPLNPSPLDPYPNEFGGSNRVPYAEPAPYQFDPLNYAGDPNAKPLGPQDYEAPRRSLLAEPVPAPDPVGLKIMRWGGRVLGPATTIICALTCGSTPAN